MKEVKCPQCGKNHIPAAQHAMTENGKFWCKPTCWIHRNDGKKKVDGRKAKIVEMSSLNGKQKTVFTSALEAAEYTGFSASKIRDACRLQKPFNGYLWKYAE